MQEVRKPKTGAAMETAIDDVAKCDSSMFSSRHVNAVVAEWNRHLHSHSKIVTAGRSYFEITARLPYRLRGFGENPVLFFTSSEAEDAIASLLKRARARHTIPILCALTDSAARLLDELDPSSQSRSLRLNRSSLLQVFTQTDGLHALLEEVRRQVSYYSLIPFATSVPASGTSFVGRDRELKSLVHSEQDFAICGPGGVGKTSLLRQMLWIMRRDGHERFPRMVEVDLLGVSDLKEAARRIAKRVRPDRESHDMSLRQLEPFLRRIRYGDERFRDGPIDLILDEVGSLLIADGLQTISQVATDYPGAETENTLDGSRYPLMQILRLARMEGLIRLTMSSRTETREMLDDPRNPFVVERVPGREHCSRMKLLPVERLNSVESQQMLFEPLRDLGCDVKSHRVRISDSLSRCEGIPFHIADVGLELAMELQPQV